jgi:hypothetical protein
MTSLEVLESKLPFAHQNARLASAILKFPLKQAVRSGSQGSYLGSGVGSSVDFHDHRQYFPGDDPRYIDWQAYARSNQYTLKLYREEVSPRVDLLFDTSGSMFLDESKALRSLELLYFALENAFRARASLRVYFAGDDDCLPVDVDRLSGYDLAFRAGRNSSRPPAIAGVPMRQGALKILVSDLLFPGSPGPLLSALMSTKGPAVLLCPSCEKESNPDWSGNMDFIDSEDGSRHRQSVDARLLEKYRQVYARHFQLWREEAGKYQVGMAQVPAEGTLIEALSQQALPHGVVELCS